MMKPSNITNRQLLELAKTYWQWRVLWLSTTALFAILGLFYVLFLKTDVWVASQGLIVRDEANGAVMRLGRFQSQTEMKTAQETILEMARNSQVLHAALISVGREPKYFGLYRSTRPPTPSEIESLASSGIEVRAPRGAELGTTEVIYLDVKQTPRERALALNKAVCDALESQLQAVRRARADGVVSELTTAAQAAQLALAESTDRLQVIEAEAGADLADLRGLTDSNSGGSTNRQVLDSIKSELRQAELQHHQLLLDLNLAKESFENPDALLLTPSRLVSNQPGLRKLREGLADATINTSSLKGRFTASNPLVIAALETESRLRDQLRRELGLAIETLGKDIEVTQRQIGKLQSQQRQLESRLENLAEIRAEYGNVVSEVRSRNTHLQEIQRELAQATASRNAADTTSLLTRLDAPLLGEQPIGPGRVTILAGATVSGLFFGFGIVFLLTPLDGQANFGRRRQDYQSGTGRRAADRLDAFLNTATTDNDRADDARHSPTTKLNPTENAPAPHVSTTGTPTGTTPIANGSVPPTGSPVDLPSKPSLTTSAKEQLQPASASPLADATPRWSQLSTQAPTAQRAAPAETRPAPAPASAQSTSLGTRSPDTASLASAQAVIAAALRAPLPGSTGCPVTETR